MGRMDQLKARLAFLAVFFVLACDPTPPGAGDGNTESSGSREDPSTMSSATQLAPLHVGEPVERPLAADEAHTYPLPLEEGRYVYLTADQHGVDVELQLLDPGGEVVVRRDSLTGFRGTERLHAVAAVSGELQVRVRSLGTEEGEPEPRYTLRLRETRPAEARDRVRAAAARAFGEKAFEEALAGWVEAEDVLEQATTRFRLGLQHQAAGDRDRTLEELEAARDLFESLEARDVGTRRLHATVLDLLSGLYLEAEDFPAALEAGREAAGIFTSVGPAHALADSWIHVGQACLWLDRTEEAMRALEDAIDLAREQGLPDKELVTRQALAQIHYDRGALGTSRREWQRVESLATKLGEPRFERAAQRSQIRIRIREDRFEEAQEPLERLLAGESSERQRLPLLQDATELYLGMDRLGDARETITQGLDLSRGLGDAQYEAMFLHLEGRWHQARQEHEEGLELQRRAFDLFGRVPDRQGQVSAGHGQAQSLYALGRYEEVRTVLETVLEAAEDLRGESLSHDLRASYLAARRHYWELYVDTLMRLDESSPETKHDELALVAAETARARSLYEQLAEADSASRTEVNEELRRDRLEVRRKLQDVELRAARRASAGGEASETLDLQRAQLVETLERLDRRMRSDLDLPRNPPELSIPALQHEIVGNPRTALVTYFFGQRRAYAWVVSHEGVDSTTLDASPEEIENMARAWAATLPEANSRARETRAELGRRLGEILLGPVRKLLPAGRLVIVPDGVLHALPFSALRYPETSPDAETRYLVERHEVIQIPSLTVLRQLRQSSAAKPDSPTDEPRSVVVFADPPYSTSGETPEIPPGGALLRAVRDLHRGTILEPLPGTRKEARAIQAAAEAQGRSCRLLLGSEARKSVLLDGSLGRVHALHFATHGLLDPVHPELSGIVLALVDEDGRPIDGYLRLHELYDLRLDARLVVLSACDTGAGKELRGEGLINLTRGFFNAGVPRVVASLWSVDDDSTAELMSRFYRFHLQKGWIPSSALNAAQRTMIDHEEWSDPYYWAGFTYQGDWAPGVGLGDDPVGQVATQTPEPTEPAGDSEVPFVVPAPDAGGGS